MLVKKINQLEYAAMVQTLKTMLDQGIINHIIADKTATNLSLKYGVNRIFLW